MSKPKPYFGKGFPGEKVDLFYKLTGELPSGKNIDKQNLLFQALRKVETDAVRGVLEELEETFCKSKVIKGDKYYITGSWTAWAIGDAISKLKSNLKEEDK